MAYAPSPLSHNKELTAMREEWERQRQADRRTVVEAARVKIDEIELLLRTSRLQRRATQRPLIYKTHWNGLDRSPDKLRYR
jgi:hypothetical protein